MGGIRRWRGQVEVGVRERESKPVLSGRIHVVVVVVAHADVHGVSWRSVKNQERFVVFGNSGKKTSDFRETERERNHGRENEERVTQI